MALPNARRRRSVVVSTCDVAGLPSDEARCNGTCGWDDRVGVQVNKPAKVPTITDAYLAGRDLLLVLDNCEHLLDDVVEFVDHLLDRTDGPAVMATSREAFEVDGEHRYRVGPSS